MLNYSAEKQLEIQSGLHEQGTFLSFTVRYRVTDTCTAHIYTDWSRADTPHARARARVCRQDRTIRFQDWLSTELTER